jgi:hypothetical protein
MAGLILEISKWKKPKTSKIDTKKYPKRRWKKSKTSKVDTKKYPRKQKKIPFIQWKVIFCFFLTMAIYTIVAHMFLEGLFTLLEENFGYSFGWRWRCNAHIGIFYDFHGGGSLDQA